MQETDNFPKLYDDTDPVNVINLVPPKLKERIQALSYDYLKMTSEEIHKALPQGVTQSLRELRASFWEEYKKASSAGANMNISNVIDDICNRRLFYLNIIQNPYKLAYILKPPTRDEVQFEALGQFATEKLFEIMNLPLKDEDSGKTDSKTASVVLKALEIALNRSKGAVLQVIHQKNLNMHFEPEKLENEVLIEQDKVKSIDDIEKELALFEAKHNKVIDLMPEVKTRDAKVIN